jgi:hypothetical protein
MSENRPALKDTAMARAHELVSIACSHAPVLRRILLDTDAPGYVPARWYRMRGRVQDFPDRPSFPGNKASGLVPSTYRMAAVMEIDREKLDSLRDRMGGVHAVSYDIGTAAMVGVNEDGGNFSVSPDDENFYQVAMRVGRGALRAAPGLWVHEQRRFSVPNTAIIAQSLIPLGELHPKTTLF